MLGALIGGIHQALQIYLESSLFVVAARDRETKSEQTKMQDEDGLWSCGCGCKHLYRFLGPYINSCDEDGSLHH